MKDAFLMLHLCLYIVAKSFFFYTKQEFLKSIDKQKSYECGCGLVYFLLCCVLSAF
jgi:hypothetical protein